MFNDREVANNNAGGRRISTQKRADSLSLAWNVQETNPNRKKIVQPQIKLNYVPPTHQIKPQTIKESIIEEKPIKRVEEKQIKQQQVFNLIREYGNLDDMPKDVLDKVLAYYDDMKKTQTQKPLQKPKPQVTKQLSNKALASNKNQKPVKSSTTAKPVKPTPTNKSIVKPATKVVPKSSKGTKQQVVQQLPLQTANYAPIQKPSNYKPKDNGIFNSEITSQPVKIQNKSFKPNQSNNVIIGDGYNAFIDQVPKSRIQVLSKNENVPQKIVPRGQANMGHNIFG